MNKIFSWDEVGKHNKVEDCWIVVHGKVYDVTKWVPKHPGGGIIINGAGREATALFLSYHPSYVKSKLDEFLIGEVKPYHPFYTYDKSQFYPLLKQRVDKYVKENKLDHNSGEMFLKTFIVILGWVIFYYLGMIRGYLLGAFFFGYFHSHLGISIAHDGCHGSYSKKNWLTYLACSMIDVMGGSSLVWCMQHNIGHHPHSNRQGDKDKDEFEQFDPDVRSGFPIMRFNPNQPWKPYHKFQHIYIFLLYSVVGARWYINDLKAVFSRKYTTLDFFDISKFEVTKLVISKITFLVYSFIIPSFFIDSWIRILVLVTIYTTVVSYNFCLVFATNHLTSNAVFPNEDTQNRDWATLQVLTSTNYATDSRLWTWISGALNFQIEHHLFPGLTHTYYRHIAPIVKQTCKEFQIPYAHYDTYFDAMSSYVDHLYELGRPPQKDKKIL